MKFRDLGEFVKFLEDKGELLRISTPVSSELEITEIVDRVVKQGGPALLLKMWMEVISQCWSTHLAQSGVQLGRWE